MPDSARPRLNAYGKLLVLALLAAVGTPLLGGPSSLAAGLLGVAVVVLAVAMRRNGSDDRGRDRRSDEDGTDETEMKAKAEAGGATGSL